MSYGLGTRLQVIGSGCIHGVSELCIKEIHFHSLQANRSATNQRSIFRPRVKAIRNTRIESLWKETVFLSAALALASDTPNKLLLDRNSNGRRDRKESTSTCVAGRKIYSSLYCD